MIVKCLISIVLVLYCCKYSNSANILAIFPTPATSHYIMFERVLIGLAEKGHDVDVVTHFPSNKTKPKSFHELSILGSLPIMKNNVTVNEWHELSIPVFIELLINLSGVISCEQVLKFETLQQLKSTKKRYDLIITEIFAADCMNGFGYHFGGVPVVSMISSIDLPWSNDRIGNPYNPSFIPNYFLGDSGPMGFFIRAKNTFYLLLARYFYYTVSLPETNRLSKDFFGEKIPDVETLIANTSLILVNSHFSINTARPTVPNFIEIAGVHIPPLKPLPKRFEDYLSNLGDNYKGVIYLSFGSMVKLETMPLQKLQGIFDAFAELPFKVLWKSSRDQLNSNLQIPDNVLLDAWMPQIDILCHPNVKLFISHGGLMSTQESISCGVPRIGVPLFADQALNIAKSEELGIAVQVKYEEISKETILSAAKKILYDEKFYKRSKEISILFNDRPMPPLDTAIYWIEYVIRHKGAKVLRSPSVDLYWFQYYLLDVALLFIASTAFFFYLLFRALRRIYCLVNSQKLKTN